MTDLLRGVATALRSGGRSAFLAPRACAVAMGVEDHDSVRPDEADPAKRA